MVSILTKSQRKEYGPRFDEKLRRYYGPRALIKANVRYDDDCGNGHNTFAITGEIYIPGRRDCEACGCLHDYIARVFPELAPFIKWHLTSSDGPMHYIENTLYWVKLRNFDFARSAAVWPEATDADLCWVAEELKEKLLARLPALMAQFKSDIESLGFVY